MKIIDKFKDKINGVLTGFDRMIIKGHIMQLLATQGKDIFYHRRMCFLKISVNMRKKLQMP